MPCLTGTIAAVPNGVPHPVRAAAAAGASGSTDVGCAASARSSDYIPSARIMAACVAQCPYLLRLSIFALLTGLRSLQSKHRGCLQHDCRTGLQARSPYLLLEVPMMRIMQRCYREHVRIFGAASQGLLHSSRRRPPQ